MIIKTRFSSDEEMETARREEITRTRAIELDSIVPAAYQKTDQSRLEQNALAEVLMWAATPKEMTRNLVLGGTTGRGKTRLAWEAIKSRYIQHGGRPRSIGAETFARRMLRETDLIDKLAWARLLLIDDLGKERMTSTAESVIFELIRERTDNELPTIYTTNFDPPRLAKRFSEPETAGAIIRRLEENSLIIDLP